MSTLFSLKLSKKKLEKNQKYFQTKDFHSTFLTEKEQEQPMFKSFNTFHSKQIEDIFLFKSTYTCLEQDF